MDNNNNKPFFLTSSECLNKYSENIENVINNVKSIKINNKEEANNIINIILPQKVIQLDNIFHVIILIVNIQNTNNKLLLLLFIHF